MFTLHAHPEVDLQRHIAGEDLKTLIAEIANWHLLSADEALTSGNDAEFLYSTYVKDKITDTLKFHPSFLTQRELKSIAEDYMGPGSMKDVPKNMVLEIHTDDPEAMKRWETSALVMRGGQRLNMILVGVQILAQGQFSDYVDKVREKIGSPDLVVRPTMEICQFIEKAHLLDQRKHPNPLDAFKQIDIEYHMINAIAFFRGENKGVKGTLLRERFWGHIQSTAGKFNIPAHAALMYNPEYFREFLTEQGKLISRHDRGLRLVRN